MKLKTKTGFRLRTGKVTTHRLSVDDNSVMCAMLAAMTVATGKLIETSGRVVMRGVDGINERARIKLEHKLNSSSRSRKQ